MNIPIYEIHHPEYSVDTEPDHDTIGKKVDDFIKEKFMGEHIAVRCLGSVEHDKDIDEIVHIITEIGHDRYDEQRPGDRYENNEGKHIDFFAFDYHVSKDTKILSEFTWAFYHHRSEFHGKPVRIDIMIIYDPRKLDQVFFTYPGREDEGERSDGWTFKNQEDKSDAIRAIIKIT